jgi:Squalene/phytoene synthase
MNTSEATERVFQYDFDHALSARFAPVEKRQGLHLLLIFDHELKKIRYQTSDPILRRIKMQFWREALADKYGSGVDLAKQLIECFAENPPILERLEELIDVHEKFVDEQNSASARWNETNQRHGVLFKLAFSYLQPSEITEQDRFFENCGLAYGGIIQLCKPATNKQQGDEIDRLFNQTKDAFESLKPDLVDLFPAARSAVLPIALVPSYLHLFEASDRTGAKLIDLHPVKKSWVLWRTMRKGFSIRK